MDFHKGIIIGNFDISQDGKQALSKISLRTVKRIYNIIPYKGNMLKTKEKGIVVNLGLFDGIKSGDKLVIYKLRKSPKNNENIKYKIIFTVKESNTLICYAEPVLLSDMDDIDSSDEVLPLKKRRAKRIE